MKQLLRPFRNFILAGILPGFLWLVPETHAQILPRPDNRVDTAFVRTFPRRLIGRLYLSRKYTSMVITGLGLSAPLRYRPNSSLNMGVGATYGAVTINTAIRVPFLNRDDRRGSTRFIDLQTHVYARKMVLDGILQFYRGFHLNQKGLNPDDPDAFYLRPDLRVQLLGISFRRIFNHQRFSFRSAWMQNEWQKRSAGTWLAGIQLFYGIVRGDSALIPGFYQITQPELAVRRIRFVKVGPGAGYAYTYVYREKYFLTGSATVGLNATLSKDFSASLSRTDARIRPDLTVRAVAGYNSRFWSVSVGWVNGAMSMRSPEYRYVVHTGNYRFTVARRFLPGPGFRKTMDKI
ncbi:DUF4421 domain-containing protein [Larkinella soli]|uniref:DUF4421 domain-containing protein n=1 Tax=Larkinella soli TaxID=1770527 RepID=UPI0013E28755|nr:DUF4421 domain-containing protein [Larkinella soli]